MTRRLVRVEDAVTVCTFAIGLLGFLSVVREIELSYSLLFAALFFLSISFEYRKRFPLPGWLLACVSVCVILVTIVRMNPEDFISLVAGALLMLLGVKLMGAKRFRDYMQIYLIALFLLIGSALLSTDIEFLLYFVLMIFLITVTVVLLTFFSQDAAMALPLSVLARIASKASLISLIAIPLTVVLFIILPRTSYPIFQFLNRGVHASTGFTDNMRLGKVSDIQEDTSVILRAHMEKAEEDLLYWRGVVLDHFDGASWTTLHKGTVESAPLNVPGKKIRQTIYIEPYGNRYLFALDKPASVSQRYAKQSDSLTYSLPTTIIRRTRYEAVSTLSDLLPERDIDRGVYLQTPDKGLDRTRDLVKTLSSGKTKEDIVSSVLRFLRNGEYRYSLRDLPVSANPLEDFLFHHKSGNCEYFASAMAVMLRMAEIPSRVVGGYRGGYYNDAGEYYLVPQKNAHVWVEAYLDGRGWLRVDPTPASVETFVSGSTGDPFFRVRLLLDSMNYYWNALVINYDFTKQVSLYYKIRIGIKNPRFPGFMKKSGTVVKYLSALFCMAVVILTVHRLVMNKKTPEERILRYFLRTMGKSGLTKGRSEGLEEFAARIEDVEMRERACRFVTAFEAHYYKDRKFSKEDVRELRLLIKMGKSC